MLNHLLDPCNLFPEVCHTQYYKKNKSKFFLYWKGCLFFQNNCVFNNLLGVTQKILYLPQCLSENPLDPCNLFPEVCHTQYYEEKRSKSFLYWKVCLFSKLCVFTNLLGTKTCSYLFHSNRQKSL